VNICLVDQTFRSIFAASSYTFQGGQGGYRETKAMRIRIRVQRAPEAWLECRVSKYDSSLHHGRETDISGCCGRQLTSKNTFTAAKLFDCLGWADTRRGEMRNASAQFHATGFRSQIREFMRITNSKGGFRLRRVSGSLFLRYKLALLSARPKACKSATNVSGIS
jgi:hypothetical protein